MIGKAHSYGYREALRLRDLRSGPRLRLIGGNRRELVEKAAASYGFEEVRPTGAGSWKEEDIDIVDICSAPGPCEDRCCGGGGGQGRVLRESPSPPPTRGGQRPGALEAARQAAC